MLRFRSFLVLVVTILIASDLCVATAQDLDNVTIAGTVSDQNGAVIPGAIVRAKLVKTSLERTAIADEEGRYKLIQLQPGVYVIKASYPNFATLETSDVATIAGQNVQLPLVLLPALITANAVIVSAVEIPQVDTTRTIVGGTITAHEVESLPVNSRAPLDLVFTLGGVSEEPLSVRDLSEDRVSSRATPEEAGNFSLSGGPAYSNNITIDGLDNNDDRSARERFSPPLEAIEEVQVIRNQFAAEYGRASGGRVNLQTRGGTNRLRGRAFYFFRDESLNANTWKNNSLGMPRLPLQEHNPGFTLSGPLMIPGIYDHRNQTFFFVAYEYDTLLDSTLIDTLVPVQQNKLFKLPEPTNLSARRMENASVPAVNAEVAPFVSSVSTPLRSRNLLTRVDRKYSDSHNAEFLYQWGRLSNLRQFGGGNRLAEALLGKTRNTDAVSYFDNYIFSAKTVIQSRFQWSRLAPAVTTQRSVDTPVVLIALNDPLKAVNGTLVGGSSTSGATDRRETRLQLQEIIAKERGAHSVKAGSDIQRVTSIFSDLTDASGTWSFDSAGDFLANAPSRFRQRFLTTSAQRNVYVGLFVQDEWRLRSQLMISFGLRYENETIVQDRNNFGPRVAFAYDPLKSGKTVIRGGAGVFYNRALLRTVDDFTLGTQQLFFDTDKLTDPLTRKLMTNAQRRAFIAANLQFPQAPAADSALVKQFGTLDKQFARRLDPDLRIPESYQANIGFERQLGKRFVVEVNYTWNRGLHLWREFNVNAPVLPNGYSNFTEYLASRDFANFRTGPAGVRPLLNVSTAGDLVRFTLRPADPANPNSVTRVVEFGVPISLVNLNSFTSTTSVNAALAALLSLRPDPLSGEVEQLISAGNSFYHGTTFELRQGFRQRGNGLAGSFRVVYTLASLRDDGIVNTSDALTPGDFRRERSRSLLDRRHRLAFSGTFDTPESFGRIRFAPILRLASGAPFNISIGGADRNLDDVANDRPNYAGELRGLKWRAPGQPIDPEIIRAFALPPIGSTGNLPRNAGTGPPQIVFDLSISREFKLGDRVSVRPIAEFDNVLNHTVFSFGSEFIDFNAFGPTSSPDARQAFIDSFLVPTRTMRARQIRLGLRLDF